MFIIFYTEIYITKTTQILITNSYQITVEVTVLLENLENGLLAIFEMVLYLVAYIQFISREGLKKKSYMQTKMQRFPL